ncbi:GNAT family N-acetyltransferase [Vibrio jasicida]|uniref:GNAT family N-acetyltransferase n=1 Tax=Vibrio jasicida TaxID=766224 RepID=UPI0040678314
MAKEIAYLLIDDLDTFSFYKKEILDLLLISKKDEAILGFDDSFNEGESQLYLKSLEEEVTTKRLYILIGLNECAIVVCCFLKQNHQKTTKHICDLQKGMIHPNIRSQGILQRTLAKIAEICLDKDIDLLTLDVRGSTKAHRIWERCGFEAYGVLQDYSRYNNKSFDGYFMKQETVELWNRFKSFI